MTHTAIKHSAIKHRAIKHRGILLSIAEPRGNRELRDRNCGVRINLQSAQIGRLNQPLYSSYRRARRAFNISVDLPNSFLANIFGPGFQRTRGMYALR